jgi:hypothetical protein
LLSELRVTATPEEFPYVASGYRSQIERMQKDVLGYLTRHASPVSRPAPHGARRTLQRSARDPGQLVWPVRKVEG